MELVVTSDGNARCVYTEMIHLPCLGRIKIDRGSHVEPLSDSDWTADLSPVNGPVLGPFDTRSKALDAELQWLNQHWLVPVRD